MSLLDVKYVVTVEFCNDIHLNDAVCFYTTEASYAATLANTIRRTGTVQALSRKLPVGNTQMIECRVISVVYGPI